MMFRDRVVAEALAQRELREARRPIPPSLRRYARRAGLGILLVCGVAEVLLAWIAWHFGALYWGVMLAVGVCAGFGALQLLTGLHIATRR